jgi:hypothetical protein
MSDLKLMYEDLNQIGQHIYKNNKFLSELSEFMEHPLSKQFCKKYLNFTNSDTTLFFVWLYRQIEHQKPDLMPFEKLAIVEMIMSNSEMRHKAFDTYHAKNKAILN